MTTPEPEAYTHARRVQPGCQHHLGCKCEVPYWLRNSTPVEQQREALRGLSRALPVEETHHV